MAEKIGQLQKMIPEILIIIPATSRCEVII